MNRLIACLSDRRGAVAIEYGLIAALVVLALLVGLENLADANNGLYGNSSNKLGAAIGR
jgi:pilus assembly protein Flp/PilA